jgi:hypothetical protein
MLCCMAGLLLLSNIQVEGVAPLLTPHIELGSKAHHAHPKLGAEGCDSKSRTTVKAR